MKPRIFVSYAHEDAKWLDLLRPGLDALALHSSAEWYSDGLLLGGAEWDAEIKAELERMDIFLPLIARNFSASRYVGGTELPIAKRRQDDKTCVIMPVLCEDVYLGKPRAQENQFPAERRSTKPSGVVAAGPIICWTRQSGRFIEHLHKRIEIIAAARRAGAVTTARTGINLPLYRQRANAKWSAIDLAALALAGAADRDTPIRLAEIFIPPQLRRSRPPMPLPRDWLAATRPRSRP